jgi:hypothetical protein
MYTFQQLLITCSSRLQQLLAECKAYMEQEPPEVSTESLQEQA